jgi:hypothetical protein
VETLQRLAPELGELRVAKRRERVAVEQAVMEQEEMEQQRRADMGPPTAREQTALELEAAESPETVLAVVAQAVAASPR